jgi:biopolymer transport protein ExbD
MAFNTQDNSDEVMSEINMTPFVDVMLVLLIIFIITIPVMKHAVNIELPRASNQPQDAKPQTIRLTVDAQGQYFWNDALVDEAKLDSLLQATVLCVTSVWRKPWRPRNARA